MSTIEIPFSREMAIAAIDGQKVATRPYCFSLPERSARGRIGERGDDDCSFCNYFMACQTAHESRPRILTLHLKETFFQEIRRGTKTEEYREATFYWRQHIQGETFDVIEICNGYPRRGDVENRMWFRYEGYRIELMDWCNGDLVIRGPTIVIPLNERLEYPYQAMEVSV
jgi:hypothetical protein